MKPTYKRPGQRAGFSLTETMVAVALLGVVVSSFYLSLSASFGFLEAARQNLRATQILVERTETLRLLKWTQVSELAFIPETFVETYDPQDTNSMKYHGTITLSELSGSENYASNMRHLQVELHWKSGDIIRSRKMQTLVSQEGIQNYVF